MSMDLAFWRYKNGKTSDHQKVYEQICEGNELDCIEQLPIEKIREKIAVVFKDWIALDADTYTRNEEADFQIFATNQAVIFNCGGMSGEEMNLLIDIMLGFGCPLYDPQISARFDT